MGFKSFRTFALTYIMQVKLLVKLLFALRPGGYWLLSSSSSTEAPCSTSPEVDLQALAPCLGHGADGVRNAAMRIAPKIGPAMNSLRLPESHGKTLVDRGPKPGIASMGRQMARAYWESPTRTQRCVMAFWPN